MKTLQFKEDYLSPGTTLCLKGICAAVVLIHHLYQNNYQYVHKILGIPLQSMGSLAVAVFFFLSGYGVMYSYRSKKEAYVRGLLLRKVLPFYGLILFLNCFYFIIQWVTREEVTVGSLLRSFVLSDSLITKGWYLYVQLWLYVGFYVAFRFFKPKYQIFAITAFVLGLMGGTYAMGLQPHWYQDDLAFLLGILWCMHKSRIDQFLSGRKSLLPLAALAFVLFAGSLLATLLIRVQWLRLLFHVASGIFFCGTVMLFVAMVSINNPVTRWLGRYSLEIYIFHGAFLELFRGALLDFKNPIVYCLCVIASTAVLVLVMKPVVSLILQKNVSMKVNP